MSVKVISTKCYELVQPDVVEDGTTFFNCNFMQEVPNTVLENFAGKALSFNNCNLTNVLVDEAWTVENSCNDQVDDIYAEPEVPEPNPEIEALKQMVDDLGKATTEEDVAAITDAINEQLSVASSTMSTIAVGIKSGGLGVGKVVR